MALLARGIGFGRRGLGHWLVLKLRAMTVAEFGTDELSSAPPPVGAVDRERLTRPSAPAALLLHGLFLGGLVLGGAASVATRTGGLPGEGAASADFGAIFGHSPWVAYAVLLGAGVLVGFGTRMAGGCTSGHVGTFLGFSLSRMGFSSWQEVHAMFTFQSLRLLLTFALGVVVLGLGWRVLQGASTTPPRWVPREIHPGSAIGGVLFGVGWALGGACPGVAFVQLGEGQLRAGLTVLAIFAGNWLYAVAHERFFRWSTRSCLED